MANILNTNFNYTYDGQLSTEIFYKPAVAYPDLTQVFRVMTDIPYKRQLNTLVPLGKIMQGQQGCGTINTTGNPVSVTNQTLETCPGEFRIRQCADTFEETILDEEQSGGIEWYNMIGEPMGNAVQRLVMDSFGRDLFRSLSFNSKTNPAGDPSYYGWCDGMWPTLIDGTSDYSVKLVDSITTLNQTAGTRALDYLRNLWTQAPIILKQAPASMRRFFVTGNVYENLLETYEDLSLTGGRLTLRVEDGNEQLFFRNIPIVPIYAWDDWIASDNLGNNTRILYTTTDNHVIGLNEANRTTSFKQWFDDDTREVVLEGRYHLGYQYVHGDLQAISFGNVS